MRKRKIFTLELTIFFIVAVILFVLLAVVGVNFIITLNRQAKVDSSFRVVANLVIMLFVSVLLLIVGIVAVVFVGRYKMVGLRRKTGKNLTDLTVEQVESTEFNELCAFYDVVIDEVVNAGNLPKWQKGVYPSQNYLQKSVENKTLFAVRHSGVVVGAFDLSFESNGDYSVGRWSKKLEYGEYLVIHTLAVKEDYQGQGIARHIVKYAIKIAKEYGVKAVRVDCTLLNGKAMRLFESLGFKSAGAFDLKRNIEGATRFQLYEYNIE